MSRHEDIAIELTEIIDPLRINRMLHPEDERVLLETVRAASMDLAEEDEESAIAKAKIANAKNSLQYFVSSLQLEGDPDLDFDEGVSSRIDRETFRAAQVGFLPCPPFCKPNPKR